MKKIILFSSLLVSAFSFAQYSTINSTSTPGLGIGVPSGTNFSDAAVHIKAVNNGSYANGGGQQFLFAETTAPSAQGDYFRLMNASGSSALFSPMLSGFGNSHTGPSLQFLALTNSSKDVGTSALMNFRAGLDFTPITSQETPNAGSNVVNRPLFQWMNWQTPTMTMDAQGKLGLGTTTPTAALHLLTGSNAGMLPPVIKLDRNDGTNQAGLLSIGISGNSFASGLLGGGSASFKLEDPYGNSMNSDMGFSTNGAAAQLVIKHNGFVGIGTETPTANLHSIGTARLQSLPTSTTNTNIITTDANGNLASQTAASLFTSSGWNLNGNSSTATDFLGTTNAQPLTIKTNNIDRAIITATGEMGVGTTTPTSQLEVTTTNITTPAIKANGKSVGLYAEATAQESNLIKRSNFFGDLDGIAVFGNAKYTTNTTNGSMYGVVGSATELTPLNNIGVFGEAKNGSGYNSGVIGYSKSTTGLYNTGVAGQVELNTTAAWNRAIWGVAPVAANHYAGYFDGNVDMQSGIVRIGNVTTPTGYKLYVEQGILTEKVKVAVATSPAWADYVFANDYNLKPLSEVEAYVKENKHLPNVPSADELVKDGLDLGKMQATQMEKIEELTLYMIEMKKEIETLKKENQTLKVLVAQPKN